MSVTLRGPAALACLGVVLIAGCQKKPEPQLHDSMAQVVVPQSQVLWDVTNGVLNDEGVPDPAKLSDADWKKISDAATLMKERATILAEEKNVKVADEGVRIQDQDGPGASKAADVQRFIDAKPADFSAHARKLANVSDAFLVAAKHKDASKLGEASNAMDGVCEACHLEFWYPQQQTQQP